MTKPAAFQTNVQGLLARPRTYRLTVHRTGCAHAMSVTLPGGGRGPLPTVGLQGIARNVRDARAALEHCVTQEGVRWARRSALAGSSMNYRPVRFCLTCKPLGIRSTEINSRVVFLANGTEYYQSYVQQVTDLFTDLDVLLRQSEKDYRETLRAKGSE